MNEEWREIPGYEDYAVSSFARVMRTKSGQGAVAGKEIKPNFNTSNGYAVVRVTKGNKQRSFALHSLVAMVFLGFRDEGHVVRHIDGDKTNNKLSNLAYGTSKDNADDRRLHGNNMFGEKNHKTKITVEQALDIKRRLNKGCSPTEIGRELGVSRGIIYRIRYGKSWKWLDESNRRAEGRITQ